MYVCNFNAYKKQLVMSRQKLMRQIFCNKFLLLWIILYYNVTISLYLGIYRKLIFLAISQE